MGQAPDLNAPLVHWLGAAAITVLGGVLGPEFAARVPFIALLGLALAATWYAIYALARDPLAQPVAFAFGGEAQPVDYARALADAGLLALIACLGLAQFSHETTPALAQLSFMALLLYGMAALPLRGHRAGLALLCGSAGLALSGAPAIAFACSAAAAALSFWPHSGSRFGPRSETPPEPTDAAHASGQRLWTVAALAAAAALGFGLDLITWQLQWPSSARGWDSVLQAFIWFTWPAWPLVLWGLWRWHRHWRSRHLAVPLALAGITLFSAVFTLAIERSLLIALPALAALAAFALPTLNRSLSALIDWFTLLFFSTCALAIWVIWVATQTGVPAKPAANVAKLAPLFEPQFSWLAFIAALLATLAWGWLVVWRTGRHRSALWKSLALPAGGTTLCWVLLMTLWLPMLDHARSFGVVISQVREAIGDSPCLQAHKLSRAEVAALTHQGGLRLEPASAQANCPWLLLDIEEQASLAESVDPAQWTVQRRVGWRANRREDLLLMRRIAP
ncbi:MAG: hypothetical protein ACO248_08790 [Burkholderiaceae bacterium]